MYALHDCSGPHRDRAPFLHAVHVQLAAMFDARHPLALVELISNGSLEDMSVEHLVAAVSCFVCEEKLGPGRQVGF